MPISVDDSTNPIADGIPKGLVKTINGLAHAIKTLSGQSSWKDAPDKSIQQLVLEGIPGPQGPTGATGPQGPPGTNGVDGVFYSHPGFKSGNYYLHTPFIATTQNSGNNGGLAANSIVYTPFFVPHALTIDRLAIRVQGKTSGSVSRLGIYNNSSNGLPGNLIVDAGEINTSTISTVEIVINQYLSTGWYWIAGNCNITPNILSAANFYGLQHFCGFSTPQINVNSVCYIQSPVTYGALPGTAPVSSLAVRSASPIYWFRVA